MANVSLSEYSHHLSQFLEARQKFDGRCAIVNRNIKLPFGDSLSFFLLYSCAALDIFLVSQKLDSQAGNASGWLLRKAHVHIFHVWIALTVELTRTTGKEGGLGASQFIASRHAYSFQHHGYIFNWWNGIQTYQQSRCSTSLKGFYCFFFSRSFVRSHCDFGASPAIFLDFAHYSRES